MKKLFWRVYFFLFTISLKVFPLKKLSHCSVMNFTTQNRLNGNVVLMAFKPLRLKTQKTIIEAKL